VFQQVRLAFAQLASRGGKDDALSVVLDWHDLPGEWRTEDERTWMTGRTGPATPESRRAREAGSVTAWRSFHDGERRWAWVQVVPLASPADARSALAQVGARLLANPRAEVRVVEERQVDVEPFAGADAVWAHEQHTRPVTTSGPDAVSLLLAGSVGSHVIVLGLSGTPAWDWDQASLLAARQAERLGVAAA
jgi:hypothetical protein